MSEDLTKNLLQSADEKLTLVLSTVQAVVARVDNVEQIVKVRLYETEPLLRKIIADIAELQEGQRRLEQGYGRFEERQRRLEQGYGRLEEGQRGLEQGYGRFEEGQCRLEQGYGRLEEGQRRLEQGYGRLEEGQESLRSELRAFRRVVDYRFLTLSGTVLDRYMKLEQRVTHLELNSNPPNTET